ncbi:GntP family permease [Synoicihabitans lomoniglobus]|uniref:SLC13 family permease n=1 Tax=Synoicihabitans lomoniglobus TaxID=2909285 RepID=A0AAF0CPU1_9BACT|nr:GntP family permease [Opitutaceae bacterium LMO-M01]WED65827.1 SLC13 family permease [Opitutaceae bacterium LMO-M01]
MTASLLLAQSTPVAGPMFALAVGVVFVVLSIAKWKIHPFFALMGAAVAVGLVTALGGWSEMAPIKAISQATAALGKSAGGIAVIIAMAAVIGECLTVSGGAERVVNGLLHLWGEKRVGIALLVAGLVLAIPVFFDTVFLLLLPLARVLAVRTGKDYMFYVLALCAGGVIAHSTVPPTPGPLLVAEELGLSLAVTIGVGLACAVVPAVGALMVARWVGVRVKVPLPSLGKDAGPADAGPLPSLAGSLAPVLLPLIMIGGASIWGLMSEGDVPTWVSFAGDKHVALGAGMIAGLILALVSPRGSGHSLHSLLGRPLELAGPIILITAAGGAFGAMLREAGIGGAITAMAEGKQLNYVLLGWLLAAVVRVSQGSATVAMITATGMLTAAAGETGWGVNPVFVFLAIGYGSIVLSWANDSGFWLVSRMCGWDERTTLKSWTVVLSAVSLLGLAEVLVLSAIF